MRHEREHVLLVMQLDKLTPSCESRGIFYHRYFYVGVDSLSCSSISRELAHTYFDTHESTTIVVVGRSILSMSMSSFKDEELDIMSAAYTNLCTVTAAPHKLSDVLLGGRHHDTNDAVPTSTSSRTKTKKSLLFLLTTLALVVPYCKVILLEFGSDTLIYNTNIHHRRPDLLSKDVRPLVPKRVANLDPADKFSFVHISKCAGSTWIRLFKKILKLNICPEEEDGVERSVSYQQQYTCKDADYTLLSLRSPRHHVWSQFTMCKYSAWGKRVTRNSKDFPRSGDKYEDDEVDFDSWLAHFDSMGNETTNHYNCYHPANFQTRALTSPLDDVHDGRGGFDPNMALAMNTYNNLDFVALVEFVHESQCMLYYRLGDKAPPPAASYLSKSCHCEKQLEEDEKNETVYVQHHNMGKRSNLRDLPSATLSMVTKLTSADSFIYVNALKHFMGEMAWLESDNALGRRVVCDDVLEKWEPELAYLDNGRFNVTQMYRDAVMEQK